jgi:cold shock CspA family protein
MPRRCSARVSPNWAEGQRVAMEVAEGRKGLEAVTVSITG